MLVRLFPASWRRAHGAAYRLVLEQSELSAQDVWVVGRTAVRMRLTRYRSRVRPSRAALLTFGSLALLGGYLSGWSELYRGVASSAQWWLVTASVIAYAVLGAFLGVCGHRTLGAVTVVSAVGALAWQWTGAWQAATVPLQVAMVWFMTLSCWLAWAAVYGDRGLAAMAGRAGPLDWTDS